jgi:hypothetical protein
MFEDREKYLAHYLLSHLKGVKSFYLTGAHLPFDAVAVTKSDITTLIEIKVRDNTINQYPDHILEVEKLDKLVIAAKAKNHKILYINFFKTEAPEQWDYIIFNMTGRIREWNEHGPPTAQIILANDKTFVSKENKREKWIIKLKYEDDKDQKGSLNLSQK